jgi:hypothetical protein
MIDPRQKARPEPKDDPNLGQEAEREKAEIGNEEEPDDELEPMTDNSDRQPKRR